MATIVHDGFRNGMLGNPNGTTTTVDFDTNDIRCSLIDGTDLSSPADPPLVSWDDYADMAQGTPVAEGGAMASKTVGSVGVGVFDSTVDYTFSTVTGDAADYLTIYQYTGVDANDALIATWDSATTGLPVTPNGGDIVVTWAAGGIITV